MSPKIVTMSALIFSVVMSLLSQPVFSQDTVNIEVRVTSADPTNPVRGANVFLMSENPEREFEKSARTSGEGIAKMADVPRDKVLIQVIAKGKRTFGKEFDLTKEGPTINIELEKEDE